jgi:hypothetical protein
MNCKDLKISEMPKANHLHGGDLIPIVQHGYNKVINVQDLVDLFKRILPPPPPPGPHPGPWCDPGHHCHPHYDPYFAGLDFDIMNKVREDAAVAKASASAVEGKLGVLQKTSDVALDSSHKALNAVKLFRQQIGKIEALVAEQAYLKAEVANSKNLIKSLKNAVLLLNERVRELERREGIDAEDIDLGGDSWLDELQDPFVGHHHHHHHHGHHHHEEEDTDFTNPLDGVEPGDVDPNWANDLLHEWGGA